VFALQAVLLQTNLYTVASLSINPYHFPQPGQSLAEALKCLDILTMSGLRESAAANSDRAMFAAPELANRDTTLTVPFGLPSVQATQARLGPKCRKGSILTAFGGRCLALLFFSAGSVADRLVSLMRIEGHLRATDAATTIVPTLNAWVQPRTHPCVPCTPRT